MKYKTTKKAITGNYSTVICAGYCELQYTLRCREPVSYTAGIYGWSADIYDVSDILPNTVIVTGYRPFGNRTIDHDATKTAEKESARQDGCGFDYDHRCKLRNDTLRILLTHYLQPVK